MPDVSLPKHQPEVNPAIKSLCKVEVFLFSDSIDVRLDTAEALSILYFQTTNTVVDFTFANNLTSVENMLNALEEATDKVQALKVKLAQSLSDIECQPEEATADAGTL